MKKLSYLVWILFVTVSLCHGVTVAQAQSVSLSVDPPVVEILLAPGKSVTQTFHLETSGDDVEVTPELHLVKPSDSEGHVTIDTSPTLLECGSPSLQECLPLTIKITGPPHTPTLTFEAANSDVSQDIYLALVFQSKASQPQADARLTTTSIAAGISSLILITITPTGDLPINIEIQDFSPAFFHDSWSPLTMDPALKNKTPIMIRPHGTYEIIAPSGKTVLKQSLYPNLILGNGSRKITSLSWHPAWHDIGPYRLRLTITSEGGTKLTEVEKTVWILPLRLIFIGLIVLILIITMLQKRNVDSNASNTHTGS